MAIGAKLGIGLSLAAAALPFAPSTALAQAAPGVPAVPAAPSRGEIDRPELRQDQRDGAPARVSVEGEAERSPCALDEPRFQDIRITVGEIQFDGLRALPPEALRPSYAAYAGTSQPISVVCRIRDAAADILRNEGYLAVVQVPPQTIETGGPIRFNVVMGKLVSVHIRGDAGPAERTIVSYLEQIRNKEVFNTREAERYLLLARDLPGYDVRLVLRPAGTAPGELVGEVLVEHRLLDVDFSLNNFGSNEVGRFGGLLRAQIYGLTGLADRTTLAAFSTADFKEQQIYQIAHDFRLGSEGFDAGARLAYALTRPELADGTDPIRSKTLLATFEVGYGFVRSRTENLHVAGGLDIINQKVRLFGRAFNEDRLRVVFARLDYSAQDDARTLGYNAAEPRWRLAGSIELRKGLSLFDASNRCADPFCLGRTVTPSRTEGDPRAASIRFLGTAEYRPDPIVTLAVSPRAQYSSEPLFAFEEFTGGNYTVGRGYDPGIISGDSGFGVQAEIRVGSLLPKSQTSFAFQPFAYVDAAWVWNEDRFTPGPRDDHIVSVGGGLRAAYGDRARLDLFAAVPTRRAGVQAEKGDVRVMMSLTVRLFPWKRD